MSLQELSQAPHSQIEVDSCVALEDVEVLEDGLDEIMLVLCLLLTLASRTDRGLDSLIQAIGVIVVADALNELMQGKLPLNVDHYCGHFLSIVELAVPPLFRQDCGEQDLMHELSLSHRVIKVYVKDILLFESTSLIQNIVVQVCVPRHCLKVKGNLRFHKVVEILIIIQVVEISLIGRLWGPTCGRRSTYYIH